MVRHTCENCPSSGLAMLGAGMAWNGLAGLALVHLGCCPPALPFPCCLPACREEVASLQEYIQGTF